MFRVLCSIALLLGLTSQAMGQQPRAVVDAQVRAEMTNFLAALSELDAARMIAHFAEDITAFVPTQSAELVRGRPAVARIFEAFVTRLRDQGSPAPAAAPGLEIQSSERLAVVTFQLQPAESSAVRRRTFVFRRTGDRWLITHFHASDVTPSSR
jgi:ketosteroid isomerase-like protein